MVPPNVDTVFTQVCTCWDWMHHHVDASAKESQKQTRHAAFMSAHGVSTC
jgi:hypothetical protein